MLLTDIAIWLPGTPIAHGVKQVDARAMSYSPIIPADAIKPALLAADMPRLTRPYLLKHTELLVVVHDPSEEAMTAVANGQSILDDDS